ncbi:MAG: preprotein translocase subunit SecA [Gemmatimonadaceae bacterium]
MLKGIVNRFFGNRHDRELKRVRPILDEIAEHATRLLAVSEEELRGQTARFREQLAERTAPLRARVDELKAAKRSAADPDEREAFDLELAGADGRSGAEGELRRVTGEILDEMLPEVFATAQEAARRLVGTQAQVTGHELEWNMVHYEVQLIGGIQLHLGKIAEMATGEGKTLVATLPLYLNALPGRGAHLVTVNSYLARRDSQWMGHLYNYLGLTVACLDDTEPGTPERRAAYAADITYGTNNEFGFDYLRDNMVVSLEQRVQRGHAYAIVDEVDSVLIDEARTPLIISGPVGNESDARYGEFNAQVAALVRRQTDRVNQLVADAERAFAAGDSQTGAQQAYKARLGGPKNRRLQKLLQESGVAQLVQKAELDHIADRKLPASKQQFREIEEDMLYVLDEKGHTVHLTDQGVDFLSPDQTEQFILPDISQEVHRIDHAPDMDAAQKLEARRELEAHYAMTSERLNVVHQLLRAHALFERDVNYVVQEEQVLIVDEYTGRTMPGRRWSEGLHQAVEAKEGVQVRGETQTLATITIQNYFRMYDKLAGMTGTAETEEGEFFEIYGLEVAVIPTNRPIARDDRQDLVYKTRREKYNAMVDEVKRLNVLGFPVLVGTVSVEVSETLSRMFQRAGIKHNVLNAKYHQREAEIVAGAGQPGAVTIATNMAGRGTDIKLGQGVTTPLPSVVKDADGKDVEIEETGGLHIVGSERHESRRIDRQLRGRAGRQGDPGASQFFLSLEDDLMRLFGSDRIARLMDRMGAQEGEVLTHSLITRSIEQAQKRVELQHFQARKRLLEFDDVMNQQREVVYNLRAFALDGGEELRGEAEKMMERAVARRVDNATIDFATPEEWDWELLQQDLLMHYVLLVPEFAEDGERKADPVAAREAAIVTARKAFHGKIADLARYSDLGVDPMQILSHVMLVVIDEKWKDHLYDLDQLRAAINYRAWGQQDPLLEYKQEAFKMFEDLMGDVANTFAERFLRVQLVFNGPQQGAPEQLPAGPPSRPGGGAEPPAPRRPVRRYNALGVLEDIPFDRPESVAASANGADDDAGEGEGEGEEQVMDIGPGEPPAEAATVRRGPVVVGAPAPRALNAPARAATEWATVGRNDPCPCGSGKKFKKCHGQTA